jgi:tetratricopeptide (TPR) repeat protein
LQDGLRDGAAEAELREKLDEAVNYYEQALVLDPPDAISNLARTHNQLGIAYGFSRTEQGKSIGHFKNAIEYFDRAGEWFEGAGARLSVAQILLRTRARFAEAQEYAKEAVEIFESIGYDGPYLIRAKELLDGDGSSEI